MSEARPTRERKVLFTDEFVQDPYPTYRRLLEEGPLHFVDVSGGLWGVWAVFRHAECSAVAKDPRLSVKRTAGMLFTLPPERQDDFKELARMLGLWMIFIDPPEHTRMRKLMNQGFSAAAAQALRPQVEKIVDRVLDRLIGLSAADLVTELAYPMPVRVISELLGVPETMHEAFLRWSVAIAEFNGNPHRTVDLAESAQNAVLALTDFFRKTVAERRRYKGDDLISLLIDIKEEGEALTEEELYAQCVMLLFAGHETTRNLIASGLHSLLREPEKAAELRDNPSLIRSAVEEFLRFESPIQYTARVTAEPVELCGVRIPKRQTILCMLGAANRDPRQFENPDTLMLDRLNNQHLAFSAGPHFCIGAQLARLEGQVAILKTIQRFPKLRLAQRPQWERNFGFRGLKTLAVQW
ncbi:MAG: cytochrome P450 [Candidatus Sulfotelmatobacter sp.]|jgi:cytochrome P450